MPYAICKICNKPLDWKASRGSRLADLKCPCGGELKKASYDQATATKKCPNCFPPVTIIFIETFTNTWPWGIKEVDSYQCPNCQRKMYDYTKPLKKES